MTAIAAAAAALAVALLVLPGGDGLGRCLAEPPEPNPVRAGWGVVVLPAGGAVVATAAALGGARAAVAATALVLVATCLWLVVGRIRVRAGTAARRAEVAWAGEVLGGLLRAGHVPATALVAAASETPVLRAAADSQLVGGEVSPALRRSGRERGHEGLCDLADAWWVAERTGASLCDAVAATAEQLSGQQEVARTVAAELASPRATGRVMATLPVAGLMLGFGFGGDPLAFLLGHPVGWVCLLAGVGLACAGVAWTEVLADRAGGD